jgi:hypothetical protein
LGNAVAASACVPGLFAPLVLDDLYPDYAVALVDGGVFDNQGVASLGEQDCTVVLVSDASGQTAVEKEARGGHLPVAMRSESTLMARIRGAEYEWLSTLREASVVRGLMYVHLKKDLEGRPVDWIDTPDPSVPQQPLPLTSYGIRRDVQRQLAEIRTDLDSFSFVEADSLMLSGYRMTEKEFPNCVHGFPPPAAVPRDWEFLKIAPIIESATPTAQLREVQRALTAARSGAFKAFQLMPKWINVLLGVVLAACGVGIVWAGWRQWLAFLQAGDGVFPNTLMAGGIFLFALIALVIALIAIEKLVFPLLRYRNSALQVLASLVLLPVGWVLLLLHLNLTDRYYIHWAASYRNK